MLFFYGGKSDERNLQIKAATKNHVWWSAVFWRIQRQQDGYWGDYQELFRKVDGKKILDAVVITTLLPDYETMESMSQRAEYFFPDMQFVEGTAEQDDTPQMNMWICLFLMPRLL